VTSIAQFRDCAKAVTKEGQVKAQDRHEKDDRRRIDDRTDYVLGWTNEQKVQALIAQAEAIHAAGEPMRDAIKRMRDDRTETVTVQGNLVALGAHDSWPELDWESIVKRIANLEAEAERIRSSSNLLQTLSDEMEEVQSEIKSLEELAISLQQRHGGLTTKLSSNQGELERLSRFLTDRSTDHEGVDAAVDAFVSDAARSKLDAIDTVAEAESTTIEAVRSAATKAAEDRGRVGRRAEGDMHRFRTAFPQEVAELDDSVESSAEYRALHLRVSNDDLPRFEAEFRRSLRENAIHEIAGLAAALNGQERSIRDRVDTINRSLREIDYNPGRFIHLLPQPTPNTEIRAFRDDLRACTSQMTQGVNDDQYSEERFLQVKAIIDRFKGREGSTDLDRAWTRRVTDVRQWFVFAASERWRETEAEFESYSDSSGKSGGQKEKLAYTILAASLAYQFKLGIDETSTRAFRFVVIDEAFGRGSDDSTRYALRLFIQLGLQLLIVTPLQKIHVIEPYVSCVGFVDNIDGSYSRLQRVTIEEHRRRRAEATQASDR
jgi:uncharacterized protein YPO0396